MAAILKILFNTLLLMLTIQTLSSQQLRDTLDKDKIYLGDLFEWKLTAVASPHEMKNILTFQLPDSFNNFTITESSTDTLFANNSVQINKKFKLICFDTGRFTLPPVTLVLKEGKNIKLPKRAVSIYPLALPSNKSINEVTGLEELTDEELGLEEKNFFLENWQLLIAGLVTILFAGYIFFTYFLKRKKVNPILSTPPMNLWSEEALSRLEGLLKENKSAVFYQTLKAILYEYIEKKYGKEFSFMTTIEFVGMLAKFNEAPESIKEIKQLLEKADSISFAKGIATDNELKQHFGLLKKIIREKSF